MGDTKDFKGGLKPRPAGRGGRRGQGGPTGPRREAPRPRANPLMHSPRFVALQALQDVVRGEAYAAQALDRRLTAGRLNPDDRRLASSLFYTAVENRLFLDAQLSRFLDSKPEPVIQDILHIAAAQLLCMDRIPDHAAVDEAVKQTRAVRREGFAGMVNGVLRNLIRARDAGELTLPDREAEPERWLSIQYSLAPVIARRMIDAYGLDMAAEIAACKGGDRAETIRPNRTRTSIADFEAWLDKREFHWKRGIVPDSYIINNAGSMAMTEGYRMGFFSIQGQSAMLAAQAVEAAPGMRILDACAAPGGKTCLMAERMGGSGRVFAWDAHEHRVALIRAAVQRLGLDNVRVSLADARVPNDSMKWSMDAVLVDAPCSGLGVIAEKPDIRYRVSEQALDALPEVQRDILNACATAVRVGGRLVYATCTILPDENERQVAAFLSAHPEFEPDTGDAWLPDALKPYYRDGMIQILPNRDGMEGFFIARMRRKGVQRGG